MNKSNRITVTITMAKIIKQTGQARAEILGQTFSEYITELIRADNKQIIDAYIKEQMQNADRRQAEQMQARQGTLFDAVKPDAPTPKKTMIPHGSRHDPDRIKPKNTPKSEISHISGDSISAPELAQLLGIGDRAVQKSLNLGKMKGYKDSKNKWRISKEEVARLQAERS